MSPIIDFQQLFSAITADERYAGNLDWGKPRPGHPEGTVRAHITDLEENLQRLRLHLQEAECWKLRILIHTHDTFKAEAMPGVPIEHPRSHASLARAFVASFCDDSDLLETVQLHDVPYALWQGWRRTGRVDEERLDDLLQRIPDWTLFLRFLIIDGCTAGKDPAPLRWFFQRVDGRVTTQVTEEERLC